MPTTQKLLTAAAGSAGDDPLYVEDVFSTYIYDGNNTTNAIVNGLDLAGEGGMLWTKRRDGVKDNRIWDTERGRAVALISNTTAANGATSTASEDLISFNSNGFTFGANAHYGQNSTSQNYVSWSFRQAENFFTMVKFTATDSFMTPAHGLGSKPGMVIYKCTTSNTDASDGHWWVWVEGMANNKTVNLDTNEVLTGIGYIGDTSATSSQFYCTSGQTYVAYYFGNDQAVFGADSDESIIKCGTYTGAGADLNINVGFEPQLVLIKSTSNAVNWVMFDTMRGLPVDGNARDLRPNTTEAEADNPAIGVTSTGFLARNGMDGQINANGYTYIYMAIRRPMKTPEAGTEVYQDDTRGGTSPTPPAYIAGFPVDVGIQRTSVSGTSDWRWANRLTGTKFLVSNQNAAQGNDGGFKFDYMDGWSTDTGSYPAYHSWMFKRAPGFMDVLCYTGDGGRRTPALTHNLGVVPELVIVKSRSSTGNWFVLSTSLGQFGFLNNGDGFSTTDIQYAFGTGQIMLLLLQPLFK